MCMSLKLSSIVTFTKHFLAFTEANIHIEKNTQELQLHPYYLLIRKSELYSICVIVCY